MSHTVAILPGVFEGPGISKKLEQALQRADYTLVSDPAMADIILGHSGGCYLVPANNQARLVVLIGLAYWPSRPWFFSTLHKIWREAVLYSKQHQLREWGQKWLYHIRYTANLKTYLRMARERNIRNAWNSTQPQIIVRNCHDVYCQPDITGLPFRGPRTFISLPGEHDDCWDNPERYVDLIQSMLCEKSKSKPESVTPPVRLPRSKSLALR